MESNLLGSDPHSKKMPLFSSKRLQRRQALDWYKKQGAALKNHIRSWARHDTAPHDATEALSAWMDRAHPTSDVLLKHDDSPLPLPRQASQPPSRRLSVFQSPVAEEKEKEREKEEEEEEQETDSPLLPFLFDDANSLEEQEDHASTSSSCIKQPDASPVMAVTDAAPVDTPEPDAKIGREGEEASSPPTMPAQDRPSWAMQLQHPQKQQPMLKDIVNRAHEMPCHMNKVKGRLYGWFLGTFLYRRPLSRRSSTKEERTLVEEEDTESAHPISTPIPTPIYQEECLQSRSPRAGTSPASAPRENELMPESKDFLAFCDSAYFGI